MALVANGRSRRRAHSFLIKASCGTFSTHPDCCAPQRPKTKTSFGLPVITALFRARLGPTAPIAKGDPLLADRPSIPDDTSHGAPARLPAMEWQANIERLTFKVEGAPFERAQTVAVAPDGTLWFAGIDKLVAVREGKVAWVAHGIQRVAAHGLAPLDGQRGWLVVSEEVQSIDNSKRLSQLEALPVASAVAVRDTRSWAVACNVAEDGRMPAAMTKNGDTWRWAPEVPHACYRAVTIAKDNSVWMVGGTTQNGPRWPTGEGVVVHVEYPMVTVLDSASSSFLSVAVTDSGEAWVGGYDGHLLHVQGPLNLKVSS